MKWWHIVGFLIIGYALAMFFPQPGAKVKSVVSSVAS